METTTIEGMMKHVDASIKTKQELKKWIKGLPGISKEKVIAALKIHEILEGVRWGVISTSEAEEKIKSISI